LVVDATRFSTPQCVDVHAHFFNASDVTVKGYLEGPVARSVGGVLGELIRALAPVAEALAGIAPPAKEELERLTALETRVATMDATAARNALLDERRAQRVARSADFHHEISRPPGREFREKYAAIAADVRQRRGALPETTRVLEIDETAVLRAMELGESHLDRAQLRAALAADQTIYPEGILAFIGYMLSDRWANLLTYQRAYTEHAQSIGVQHALGALVDFDRWLDCPPRSSHEDQLQLHLQISRKSAGYLQPIVAYNPWTDQAEGGRSLDLVKQAMAAGCVAVKIYPSNGFRPWGNAQGTARADAPSGADLDRVLKEFWTYCAKHDVPVMAHTSQSMGKDNMHDSLGGPDGWRELLGASFWTDSKSPRVNLGHFGGDAGHKPDDWTQEFAELMSEANAAHVYADLGYWDDLQCGIVGADSCKQSVSRLRDALRKRISDDETVADRVMYGSDWLMLSKERYWPSYAGELHAVIREFAPGAVQRIFAQNARRCFSRLP
jgi:predicted TIM-barrel fold metal-dependent hydrolase